MERQRMSGGQEERRIYILDLPIKREGKKGKAHHHFDGPCVPFSPDRAVCPRCKRSSFGVRGQERT
jgi:hypothetical protein